MCNAMQQHVLCLMRTTEAHSCILISLFIQSRLVNIICILAIFKVSRFQLHVASMVAQTGFNLIWLPIPKDKVSRDVVKM